MSDIVGEQTEKTENTSFEKPGKQASDKGNLAGPRKIPGNLPYLTASGTLKKVLDKICEASRPDKFNADFLENVLKITGSSARATIPIPKKMGLLATDGAATDLYSRFRSETGRPQAALQGLKNAFPEMFKRSEYVSSADDKKIRDLIIEITGLPSDDPVANAIKNTFNVIKNYIPRNFQDTSDDDVSENDSSTPEISQGGAMEPPNSGVRLSYNINIVLPETSDLKVLNAIFKALKENLMQ